MTRTILLGAIALACVAAAPASSPFDGTWKGDVKSAKLPTKPDVFLLEKGTYTCKTCVPELVLPADGAWHKVTGHPYYDEAMVKVVDAHTTKEAYRKAGKPTTTGTTVISADGKTLTYDFTNTSGDKPVVEKGTAKQVAKGPAGSHAISGSWQTTSVDSVSDSGLTYTFKTEGDMLTLSTPTGIGYTAKFGGPAVAIKGDKANTMAAVKKTGPNSFVETDTRAGKVILVMTTTVSADGKSQMVVNEDKLHGTTTTFKANKQ